jgi:antirestriction protein ArdC/phage/plasmid primase-like uncharacterized protein
MKMKVGIMATERAPSVKRPFHEVVAEQLIEQIKAGAAPWQKSWSADGLLGLMPMNPTTGARYRGINSIFLMSQGRSDPRWVTFKQAQANEWQVRKGEKGTQIQYWKFEDSRVRRDALGNPVRGADGRELVDTVKLEMPRVFFATVFNAEQIEGIPALNLSARTLAWDPLEQAERIIVASGAKITHVAQDSAFYSMHTDSIQMPLREQFKSAEDYYIVLLHELGHWTGHSARLARDMDHSFGSQGYAREELRAEIASMLIGAEVGIAHDPSRHAGYIESWQKAISQDPMEIFRAAADAQKILTFITDLAPQINQADDPEVVIESRDHQQSPQVKQVQQPQAEQDQGVLFNGEPRPLASASRNFVPLSYEEARVALSHITADLPRDEWARMAMAIKSEFPDDAGFALFDEWSQGGQSYNAPSVRSTWSSIASAGFVTIATLVREAQAGGWRRDPAAVALASGPGGQTDRPSLTDASLTDASLTDANSPAVGGAVSMGAQTSAAQERTLAQERASSLAQQMWSQARLTEVHSAYLERKQVGAHGIGITEQGVLLVPMVDVDGKLWNLQRILPEKTEQGNDKFFLKGGRKSGLMHMMGEIDPDLPLLVAEGYATAASLHELTRLPVVVAFDAGNLIHVAQALRSQYPQQHMVIAGDDDVPTFERMGFNPGREKALAAAQSAGAGVIFPSPLAAGGSDFNDLAVQLGSAQASAEILKSLSQPTHLQSQPPQQEAAMEQTSRSLVIHAREFADEDRALVQKEVMEAVLADPMPFIRAYEADPRSYGGRYVSSDLFKETFEQYKDSNESRLRYEAPVHNSAAALADFQLRRLIDAGDGDRGQVIFFTGVPGAGKTSSMHARGGVPAQACAVFEGQLANGPLAIEKIEVALEAGLEPIIHVVHQRPEVAMDNTLERFERYGRGASIAAMSRIQGNLPAGLEQIRDRFGDRVQLNVYDQTGRFSDDTRRLVGWQHLEVLRSEGNEDEIRAKLASHLETRRADISDDAWRQAAGEVPRRERGIRPQHDSSDESTEGRPRVSQRDPETTVLIVPAPEQGAELGGEQVSDEEVGEVAPDIEKDAVVAQRGTSEQPENTLNSIEFGEPQVEVAPSGVTDPKSSASDRLQAVLAKLAQEYDHDGVSKWYFKDQKSPPLLAFELASGSLKRAALQTPHEAPEVLASMAELAAAQGWTSLTVKGTPDFCREMWLQASLAGIRVYGYVPEPIDVKRLTEMMAIKVSHNSRQINSIETADLLQSPQVPAPLAKAQKPEAAMTQPDRSESVQTQISPQPETTPIGVTSGTPVAEPSASRSGQSERKKLTPAERFNKDLLATLASLGTQDSEVVQKTVEKLTSQDAQRRYVGEVIDHGEAPYNHEKDANDSYFIQLKAPDGHLFNVWGIDLPRALSEQESEIKGQHIVLSLAGSETVTVPVSVKNENGVVIGTEDITTQRNNWVIQNVQTVLQDSLLLTDAGRTQFAVPEDKVGQGEFDVSLSARDRQRLEILATSMRLAKVPIEFSNLTMAKARQILQDRSQTAAVSGLLDAGAGVSKPIAGNSFGSSATSAPDWEKKTIQVQHSPTDRRFKGPSL